MTSATRYDHPDSMETDAGLAAQATLIQHTRPGGPVHLALLTALVTSAALLIPATPATAALATGVTHETLFSDPGSSSTGRDSRIHNRLITMFDQAPAGSTVEFTIWNWSHKGMADAVLRAKARGVNLRATANGANTGGTQYERVRTALGANFRKCVSPATDAPDKYARSCISTLSRSYGHAKLWTFSQTGTKRNVVVVTTHNPTNHTNESNDAVITAGDLTLYNGVKTYMDDMFHMRKNNNYGISAHGVINAPGAAARFEFSPRLDSSGGTNYQLSTDSIGLRLARLVGPTKGGGSCSLLVNMMHWDGSRKPVLNQIVRIKREGCTVKVVTDGATASVIDALKAAGITPRTTKKTVNGVNTKSHGKTFLMRGTIGGASGSAEWMTGSQNLFRSSLRYADEVLASFTHPSTVDAAEAFHGRLWANGRSL